ncbi:TPA: GGDEF domain-containing protein [Yersinia enterocolitica]|uniref:GGDEF domain-containing protein n=1 Tax=Yersinia enterocolitica TaxID=630 RepID=UPI0029C22960|nr:GGDEF domain-containing protein [Yersinia enterocolitica]
MFQLIQSVLTSSFNAVCIIYFCISLPYLYILTRKNPNKLHYKILMGLIAGFTASYLADFHDQTSTTLYGLILSPIVLTALIFGPISLLVSYVIHVAFVFGLSPFYDIFIMSFMFLSIALKIWDNKKYYTFFLSIFIPQCINIALNFDKLVHLVFLPRAIFKSAMSIILLSMLYLIFTRFKKTFSKFSILKFQSSTDQLTKLPNRFSINRHLDDFKKTRKDCFIALIDIDFFKNVNDNHGHSAGDKILYDIAQELRSIIRGNDFLGRYGGEEFLLLIHTSDRKIASEILDRIILHIRDTLFVTPDNHSLSITISIGAALYVKDSSFDHAIELADKSLYQAKNGGRDQFVLF